MLPAIVEAQDEPFGSTSIVAQWFVMRAAGEAGLKVMLDGQGGDETLAGYRRPLRRTASPTCCAAGGCATLGASCRYRALHGAGAARGSQALLDAVPAGARRAGASRGRRGRSDLLLHPRLRGRAHAPQPPRAGRSPTGCAASTT